MLPAAGFHLAGSIAVSVAASVTVGTVDEFRLVVLPRELPVELDVDEVDRLLEIEELSFCRDTGVVLRLRTALDADWLPDRLPDKLDCSVGETEGETDVSSGSSSTISSANVLPPSNASIGFVTESSKSVKRDLVTSI